MQQRAAAAQENFYMTVQRHAAVQHARTLTLQQEAAAAQKQFYVEVLRQVTAVCDLLRVRFELK